MKKLYTIILVLSIATVNAQIGINTSNPLATLEVHRSHLATVPDGIIPPRISADSLQMKDHLYGPAQNGTLIYVTKPNATTTSKTRHVTSSGYYVYDSSFSNKDKSKGIWKKMFSDPHAFTANTIGPVSFSNIGLISSKSNFQSINFDSAVESEIGSEYISDNQYLVPETGLYVINYSIQFDNVDATKFSQRPSVAIVKSSSNNSKRGVLSSRMFDGIVSADGKNNRLSLSSQSGINHIYQLKEGERLNFGLMTDKQSLSSLGQVSTQISIYKIR